MKRTGVFIISLCVFLCTLSADVIPPGSKAIPVTSRIGNILDFPDHIFFSAQTGLEDKGMSLSMCPVYLVAKDGTINRGYYKLCGLSVYAVEREKIDLSQFDAAGKFKAEEMGWDLPQTSEYLRSLEPVEVIRGIDISLTVPVTSAKKMEEHTYTVELGVVKEQPDKIRSEKSSLTILYYILPIPALFLVGFLTYRRFRRKN